MPALAYLLAGLVLWTLAGNFRPARQGDATLGGTVGPVSAERLCRRRGEVTWLRIAAGALPLLFVVPAWVPDPAATAATFMAIGMAAAIHKVLVASLAQRLVTEAELGRVNATMRLLGPETMPIGAVLGGPLGSAAGLATVFHAAAGLCLAGLLVILPKGTGQAIRSASLRP